MEDGERHPGPLRIVKRSSNAPIRPSSSSSNIQGLGPDPNHHPRRASAATDESMGSLREESGATQRSLSIPKKRRTIPSRLDGGASRFYTASAAYSASVARRRLNDTDSFGSGSESGDVGPRDNGYEADDGRYSSVRSQYLRDGHHDSGNHGDDLHQQSRSSSSHSNRLFNEEEDAINNFQRMRLGGDGAGIGDDRRHPSQYYDPRSEDAYGLNSGQLSDAERRIWLPDRSNDFGRQASISTANSDRRGGPYGHLPAPAPHHSCQPHTYGGRPVSSDILLTGPNLFPSEPFVRPSTEILFDSPHKSHQPSQSFQHRQMDASRNRLGHRLSQLITKPDRPAEIDPQILVPIVSVTPECRTVEGNVNSFWVAVELFAHITQPLDTGSSRDYRFRQDYRHASTSSFSTDDDQGLYRFGYISGMDIKILSSYQSEILEVIGKSPSLITLLPGSRRLMVVHVHLDTTKSKQPTESRDYRPLSYGNRSDQLLEDLELQLGSTSQEYMQIQLTYSHSGFPKRDVGRDPMDRDGGCIEVRTTIKTTVTAVVMQQNSSSMWSPSAAPAAGSPLVDIVAKHWGPSAAKEMAKKISTSIEMRMLRRTDTSFRAWDAAARHSDEQSQKWCPGTPENATLDGSLDEVTPRAASQSQQQKKKNDRQDDERHPEKAIPFNQEQQPKIPPRKAKKEYRDASSTVEQPTSSSTTSHKRVSLSQVPRLSMSSANIPMDSDPPSPGCLLPRSKNARLVSGGPRQAIPDAAPRNIRRPVGMNTTNLHNLAHGASEQSFKSENCDDKMAAYGRFRSSSRSSTVNSKRSGKWSWPGWFS